jgi:hypothetical protein
MGELTARGAILINGLGMPDPYARPTVDFSIAVNELVRNEDAPRKAITDSSWRIRERVLNLCLFSRLRAWLLGVVTPDPALIVVGQSAFQPIVKYWLAANCCWWACSAAQNLHIKDRE